ncbi:IS3 family transposase [Streptomyces sp. NBC_00826]|uniref:IS3 family transposase n=1 Tax=Streptomyces sp. NBC_00826 TaxID=2975845 RepID=UPI002F910753|nr:IS3 family transposase [Streptomyces sp. NBC_00826]
MNRYQFVDDHQRRHGVKRLCDILGLARSSFYYWRRTASARAARQTVEAGIAARIRKVHQDSDGTYGAPRITAELRDEGGPVVNHKRVARIMRSIGLEGVRLRRRHRTTVADQTAAKAPVNLPRDAGHSLVLLGGRGHDSGLQRREPCSACGVRPVPDLLMQLVELGVADVDAYHLIRRDQPSALESLRCADGIHR